MTAITPGCIDGQHDHVDQCHQAGRTEVEAKYAALVAAVAEAAGQIEAWRDNADRASNATGTADDYVRVRVRVLAYRRAAHILRAVLADPAEGAEGGDRG